MVKHHDQCNLEKELILASGSSAEIVGEKWRLGWETEITFLTTNTKQEGELEVGYELHTPVAYFVQQNCISHNLPKWYHHLGTRCSTI